MDHAILSNANLHIRSIIYGTAWKNDASERLVSLAVRNGFRGIDTACQPKHYNEAGVGAGLAAGMKDGLSRHDLYLQTKFTPLSGQDPKRVPYDQKAPLAEQVAQSIAASLKNLQTNYLDCLLLHSPMPTMAETLAVWRTFESFSATGEVRQLGISNCYRRSDLQTLYESAHIKPAVLQNRFYAETGYDHDIRTYCNEKKIIYQSFWTLSANAELLAHATMTTLAARYKRTVAQVLFRYLTQVAVVPLTGTRSEAHMREDLAIFDFELSQEEQLAIEKLC